MGLRDELLEEAEPLTYRVSFSVSRVLFSVSSFAGARAKYNINSPTFLSTWKIHQVVENQTARSNSRVQTESTEVSPGTLTSSVIPWRRAESAGKPSCRADADVQHRTADRGATL